MNEGAGFASLAQIFLGVKVTARRKKATAVRKKRRTAKPKRAPTKQALVRRAEAAEHFGVEPSRINRWVADGAPVSRRGKPGHAALYDLKAMERWRAERRERAEAGLSLSDEQAKLAESRRKKIDLEHRVRLGELIERHEVVAEGQAFVRASQTRLLQVPRQASQAGLIPREREPELRALISEACRDLASWGQDLAATA